MPNLSALNPAPGKARGVCYSTLERPQVSMDSLAGCCLRVRLCPALQNRADAARAKDELNDVMLHDNELHIGWGKSIPIPAQPMFVLAGHGGSQLTQPKGAAIAPPGFMASNWDLPPPGEEYVGECLHRLTVMQSSRRVTSACSPCLG